MELKIQLGILVRRNSMRTHLGITIHKISSNTPSRRIIRTDKIKIKNELN
jgi:hypothetical protein